MKYNIACRVRNCLAGIDAEPTDHGTIIDDGYRGLEPDFMNALHRYLVHTEGAWLACTEEQWEDLRTALAKMNTSPYSDAWECDNDWFIAEYEQEDDYLKIIGHANCGEYEYELEITEHKPKQVRTQTDLVGHYCIPPADPVEPVPGPRR
jgi:hypothetical protein